MSKHPAYGQSLLKLGIHLSDPIAELGMAWARGDHASARLIYQAILSAEHLRQGRDKMLARVAGSIINKLKTYHSEALRDESRRHKSPYAAHSLTGRRNPGKRKHDARSLSRKQLVKSLRQNAGLSMQFRDEVDNLNDLPVRELRVLFNSCVRSNPYKEDRYYADRLVSRGKRRGKARATKRGMRAVLGRMNPRPNENDIPTVIIKRNKRNPNARKMRAASKKRLQVKRSKHVDNFHRAIAFQYTPPLKKRGASRNPAISSKDATAMCRILRNHGYTCTKKGAKHRSKARSKSRK